MKYDPALDGLRAFAVAAVVLFHVDADYLPGGWAGVDVFFALSGFLITKVLASEIDQTGTIALKRFYMRRALRLTPALVVLLAFLTGLAILQPHRDKAAFTAILFTATYTMNWARALQWTPDWMLGHTWSLAMEEQFYLLWPAVLLVVGRGRRLPLTLMLILLIAIWRCYLVAHGASVERTYNGFDTHADALLIGCVLAFLPEPARLPGHNIWSGLAVVSMASLFLFVPLHSTLTQTCGLTAAALISVGTLTCARSNGWLRSLLVMRPIVFTGRISYGLYLWHYPLIAIAKRHLPEWAMFVPVVLAYLAAMASFYIVEQRFQRMKNRFLVPQGVGGGEIKPAGSASV